MGAFFQVKGPTIRALARSWVCDSVIGVDGLRVRAGRRGRHRRRAEATASCRTAGARLLRRVLAARACAGTVWLGTTRATFPTVPARAGPSATSGLAAQEQGYRLNLQPSPPRRSETARWPAATALKESPWWRCPHWPDAPYMSKAGARCSYTREREYSLAEAARTLEGRQCSSVSGLSVFSAPERHLLHRAPHHQGRELWRKDQP